YVSILLDSNHNLRPGWKFAAYVSIFLLIWFATGIGLSMVFARSDLIEDSLMLIALNEIALFVPAVAALLLTVRFADHRPLKTFGIGFLPFWRRDLCSGLGLAALMVGVLLAGCYGIGYVHVKFTAIQAPAVTLISTLLLLLLAAANEELVF